jgi:hypothetical protein
MKPLSMDVVCYLAYSQFKVHLGPVPEAVCEKRSSGLRYESTSLQSSSIFAQIEKDGFHQRRLLFARRLVIVYNGRLRHHHFLNDTQLPKATLQITEDGSCYDSRTNSWYIHSPFPSTHTRRLTDHLANVRVIHAVFDGGILRGYSDPELVVGIRADGRYYAAVVSLLHRNSERDDLAMTIEARDCQSDGHALVELYRVSQSLLNHVRRLCEGHAGRFEDWRDLGMP